MATKTIYTCDKCGAEQNTRTQFWTLQVTARTSCDALASSISGLSIEVCRSCLEKYGIYAKEKPKPTPEENRITLESLIIDIIKQNAVT